MQDTILKSIEKRFAADEPIKMMLYGDWGVGKTHAVNHIAWWLDTKKTEYPAYALIVELSDVTKKSRFDTLVRPFLDKLGLDGLIKLVHDYERSSGDHITDGLRKAGVSPHVVDALAKFLLARVGDTQPPNVLSSFEYLKGGAPRNAGDIGLGPLLTTSDDFFNVLKAVGILYEQSNKLKLVFVCDEAAKLDEVDRDDGARGHWTGVNRLIFDDNNDAFGFIYTMSGKSDRDLALVLTDNQIRSRLGEANLIELRNLEENDVETFLRNLLDAFVDKECVSKLIESDQINKSDYAPECYPFTKGAFQEFVDYWAQNGERAKPRDICEMMNDVGFVAIKRNSRLIDDECLHAANVF
jgi:Cdc6-like AAA superfamily ATPase